ANKRSIAWAITQAAVNAGAQVALTYQGERLEENVRSLAESLEDPLLVPCDVTDDDEIARTFEAVGNRYGRLDFLVHSVAFAPKEAHERPYVETGRDAYRIAQEVSAYSLVPLARHARELMTSGGSIMAMTYYGSEKV